MSKLWHASDTPTIFGDTRAKYEIRSKDRFVAIFLFEIE
jgi:hypothetical protein